MFISLNFSFLDIFLFLKNFCHIKYMYCSGSVEHKDKEHENLFINECRSNKVKFNLVPLIASSKMFLNALIINSQYALPQSGDVTLFAHNMI